LKESHLIEDAGVAMSNARKVTDQIARIVNEVERGKGWANALIYQEPVALQQLNAIVASTQKLLDRVERGEGAAGVLTSAQSTEAARRLVAAMGGRLWIEDKPAGGSQFVTALPEASAVRR
jgi:HJR/Mrr/RecB family endonuclease